VAGVAIGAAVAALAILVVLPTVAGDLLLRRTLQELDPSERAVTVALAPESQPTQAVIGSVDAGLRARLAVPGIGPLRRLVEFRALAMPDGTLFRLGGMEDLNSGVQILDGRLPQSCTPNRCEVVAVGKNAGTDLNKLALPDVVIVGHVARTDPVPFTGGLTPNVGETLLLSGDPAAVNAVESIRLIRRVDAWVATIVPSEVNRSALAQLLVTLPAAAKDITIPGVTIDAPDTLLRTALSRADVAGRSLALPIGQTLVLLFGVSTLVGLGLRNRHRLASDRLARRGADRSLLMSFDAISGVIAVGAGCIIGTATGALASWLLLRGLDLPTGPTLRAAWTSSAIRRFVAALVALWLVTTGFMRLRVRDGSARQRRVLSSDLIGLVTIGVIALLLKRGNTSTAQLSTGTDPLLWSLPILLAVTLACAAVRIVPILLSLAGRSLPSRAALARIALLDATRRPLRPLAAASIIAAAVAFGSFALSYRTTLMQGAREQAAFEAPFDATLNVGRDLVRPWQLTKTTDWNQVLAGTTATDVLRRGVTLRRSGTGGDGIDLIGLDPATLTSARSWRPDYGASPEQASQALTLPPPVPVGSIIPDGTTTLRAGVVGTWDGSELAFVLARADGTWHEELAAPDGQGRPTLVLEATDRGGRFIGFRVGQPASTTERIEHHVGEGNTGAPAASVALAFRDVIAVAASGDVALPFEPSRFSSRQANVTVRDDGSMQVEVALQGSAALVLPTPSRDPLPALVDTVTASAAQDGIVTIDTSGSQIAFRVVGVAPLFPTASNRFIVTDVAHLRQHLDLAQPGFGTPTEVWLASDTSAHETELRQLLQKAPYQALKVDSRVERYDTLRTDPLSRMTLAVLLGSAALAGLLAAGALALNAVAERSEDEAFHRALALEGATHRVISKLVADRAMGLALVAVPVGLVGGGFLVSIIVDVVKISATAGTPQPPLRLFLPWLAIAAALGGVIALFSLTARLASRLARSIAPSDLLRGQQ
jgi:hypothetical protein